MQERPSAPQTGAEEDKNAVFARVWRRVMGDQPMACPIVWDTGGASPTQAPEAPEGAEPSEEATQEAGTKACALPAPPPGCRPAGDFPREDTMGVLGPGSLDSAPVLQTLLRRELADAREYQQLSRRASGPPARMLAALSGEKKHRMKRTETKWDFDYYSVEIRRALLAGGGKVPAHALVLRHAAPPLRPGADDHGGLSHRHRDHRRPLPAPAVL